MSDSALLGFGIPGFREIVLVALVALALYGKTGTRLLMTTRYGRMLSPWVNLARPAVSETRKPSNSPRPGSTSKRRGRLFWALALTAAAAVAAWVATRVVVSGSAVSH
jgi:hypothetical protein